MTQQWQAICVVIAAAAGMIFGSKFFSPCSAGRSGAAGGKHTLAAPQLSTETNTIPSRKTDQHVTWKSKSNLESEPLMPAARHRENVTLHSGGSAPQPQPIARHYSHSVAWDEDYVTHAKDMKKSMDKANSIGQHSSVEGEDALAKTLDQIRNKSMDHFLSAVVGVAAIAITVAGISRAFSTCSSTLEVASQHCQRMVREDFENRWRVIHILGLLCLYMKISSCAIVAVQEPLQVKFGIGPFEYNALLSFRCVPGLLATLVAPSLQHRFASSHLVFILSLVYATGAALQAVAIWQGSFKFELLAVLLIEGSIGAVVAITAAVCTCLVDVEEQPRAVTIVSLYSMLGMSAPLMIIPWLVDLVGLSMVIGVATVLGGVTGALSGFAFFHVTQADKLDKLLQDDLEGSLLSSDVWRQGQTLGIIAAMSLINAVAMTLGEKKTTLPWDSLSLKKEEVTQLTFWGLVSCMVSQMFGIILEAKEGRTIASVFSAVTLSCTVGLCLAHNNPVLATIFPDMIAFIMVLATAGKYICFIAIPILYGYHVHFHGDQSASLLLALLIMAIALFVFLNAHSHLWNKTWRYGILFGTRKDVGNAVPSH